MWVFHAQVHDHVEVAANLAGRIIHPYDVQIGFDVWFVYPTEIDGLVVRCIGEWMASWVHGVHSRCISCIAVSCFIGRLWINTNLWFTAVTIVDADQRTRHSITVVLIVHPWVVLEGQHPVFRPCIDKAGAVCLQVLERNQVVVSRNQTLEGVQALSVGFHNLARNVVAQRWHGRCTIGYDRQVVQYISHCPSRTHGRLVANGVKCT